MAVAIWVVFLLNQFKNSWFRKRVSMQVGSKISILPRRTLYREGALPLFGASPSTAEAEDKIDDLPRELAYWADPKQARKYKPKPMLQQNIDALNKRLGISITPYKPPEEGSLEKFYLSPLVIPACLALFGNFNGVDSFNFNEIFPDSRGFLKEILMDPNKKAAAEKMNTSLKRLKPETLCYKLVETISKNLSHLKYNKINNFVYYQR